LDLRHVFGKRSGQLDDQRQASLVVQQEPEIEEPSKEIEIPRIPPPISQEKATTSRPSKRANKTRTRELHLL